MTSNPDNENKNSEGEIVRSSQDEAFSETTKEGKLRPIEHEQPRTELSIRSGPLPDPDTLNLYENVVPGAADRIIAMAEKQQRHRTEMEAMLVQCQVEDTASARRETARGQNYGLAIGLSTIASGTLIAVLGSPVVGAGIMGTTLVGLVSVFVIGKNKGNTEANQLPPTGPDFDSNPN